MTDDLSAKLEAAMRHLSAQAVGAISPSTLLSLAEGSKLLHQLSAVSEIPITELEQRFGKLPGAMDVDMTRMRSIATESELYNDVIRSMTRYYAYHGRFPGDASQP